MSTGRMLGVSRVVATVEGPAVVADRVAVVAAAGHAVRVAGEAQSSQREGHGRAQLLSESLGWRKSLQMNHENLRKTIQRISLGALPPCLAGLAALNRQQ